MPVADAIAVSTKGRSSITPISFQEVLDASHADAPVLDLHVLASGSHGNASVAVDRVSGQAIVVDCGICRRDFMARLEEVGVRPHDIAGIFITHEHTDHTKGLGVVLRGMAKAGIEVPVFASDAVKYASKEIAALGSAYDIRRLSAGNALSLGGMDIHPFATSHDSVESFGFRVEVDGGEALGFMTDTGVVTDEAFAHLQGCRILAIESNHDVAMLAESSYPYVVKRRIASDRGHLSNEQSAVLLENLLCRELEQVVAMHISENSNTYRVPGDTLSEVIVRNGHTAQVHVAYQYRGISVG